MRMLGGYGDSMPLIQSRYLTIEQLKLNGVGVIKIQLITLSKRQMPKISVIAVEGNTGR